MRTAESKLREGQIREAKLAARVAELDGVLSSVEFGIARIVGGVSYDGEKTNSINYLQRLRILVEREAELDALKLADARRTVALDEISACLIDMDPNNSIEWLVNDREPFQYLEDGDMDTKTVAAAHDLLNQQEADNDES